MTGKHASIILLPTLKCNVECDYCFEEKTGERLSLDEFQTILDRVVAHMVRCQVQDLTIYWQGGEIMTLPPSWFVEAYERIQETASRAVVGIHNSLQSNMIGYSERWNDIIEKMFGNDVGTSMDFPNIHRKLGGSVKKYNEVWSRNMRQAREAGIHLGVIALPNPQTLELGAEAFYTYFVEESDVVDFQVNMPFPGGGEHEAKDGYPLDPPAVGHFLCDLTDIWIERGFGQGVKIGPMDELLNYFSGEQATLPCIWQDNCVHHLASIDARGNVSQCDCWVTSYPEASFGNILETEDFTALLETSPARKDFVKRPAFLMENRDCGDCEYLGVCHGGCPVRTYSVYGHMFEKDPYCETYKLMFGHLKQTAVELSAQISRRADSVVRSSAPPPAEA